MPSQSLRIEGIILKKEEHTESHIQYYVLSPNEGGIYCLKKKNKSLKNTSHPDILDQAEFELLQSQGGHVYFIQDYEPIKQHTSIGKNYNTFKHACEFGKIISKNLHHAESFHLIYKLCLKAFDAWDRKLNPEIVYIKSLYLFTKEEGYPVKEQWIHQLNTDLKKYALHIISTPIESCQANDDTIQQLLENLKKWIPAHTDIII